MQTTLRIDDAVFREAKAEAARAGVSLTRFIEEALRQRLAEPTDEAKMRQRNQLMDELARRTEHFLPGTKPTREEMNER